VFEAETDEVDVMARPPRDPKSPLFSVGLAGWSIVQGVLVLLLVAAIYIVALRSGFPESELRALTFVSLVFTNIGLIFINRSFSASLWTAMRRPNLALWWAVGATLALIALTISWTPAERLFHFGPLHPDDLAICAGAGIATLLLLEVLKPIWQRRLVS
jgi:Ca2+-transporting ATPase